MTRRRGRRCRVVVTLCLGLLAGCRGQGLPPTLAARVPVDHQRSAVRRALVDGLGALYEGRLDDAAHAFNQGLAVEPGDAHLNFLNGFVYHARAESVGPAAAVAEAAELAEVGYRLALRFDPDHWLAAWHLGRLCWNRGRLAEARASFATALRARSDHAPSVYGLAATSYAMGDPVTAATALDRLPSDMRDRPAAARARAVVHAALGDGAEADIALADYRRLAPAWSGDRIASRVAEWGTLHARASDPGSPHSAGGPGPAAPSDPTDAPIPDMVVLDVVIVSQESTAATRRGINLLSALKVQFGGTLLNGSRSTARDVTRGAVTAFSENTSSSLTIGIPTVQYALNIANAGDSHSEIVARPSVLAHDGEQSELFIGSEVTYLGQGTTGSRSFSKEVGITLTARPTFIDRERLRLRVSTQFSAYLPTAAPGTFDQALATVKNRSAVTADVRIGQTLAMAVGTNARTSEVRSGVPILRDIPVIQYLFSEAQTSRSHATLMILLTPRRPARLGPDGQVLDLAAADPAPSPALVALQERYDDWLRPTPNTLVAMHRLLGGALHREYRRGDLQYAGMDDFDEPEHEEPVGVTPRYRQVVRDVIETLYF